MKLFRKKRTIVDLLTEVFRNELQKGYEKELRNDLYMSASFYKTIEDRVKAGLHDAFKQVTEIAVLKVAQHRQNKHGENTVKVQDNALDRINTEYIPRTKNQDGEFWNG